jgi:organic hydroperoxide reductase OsmC/OhrA
VRGISVPSDDIACTAEGTNEIVDRIVVLTKIDVHYTIRLPEGADREKVDRALASHVDKCPTARSIEDSVRVAWTADIIEAGASSETA